MNRVVFLEQSSLQKKRGFKKDPWVPWAPQGPQGSLGAQHTVSTCFSNREFSDEQRTECFSSNRVPFRRKKYLNWTPGILGPPGFPGSPWCPAHSQHWLFRTENSQMNRTFFLDHEASLLRRPQSWGANWQKTKGN